MRPHPPTTSFELGAMYWQNPNLDKAAIEEDMRRIVDNNLTIIRTFVWWEKVERREGALDFRLNDLLYEAADKYGLGIMETYGLYLPHWLLVRLSEQGIVDTDRYYCMDRPEVAGPMRRFVEAVVSRYRNAPALKIWNVWNEPTKPPCHCEHTRRKFITWLKQKYRNIDALQKAWLGEFQVFDTLCPDNFEELSVDWLESAFRFGKRGRITPLDYDWHQFSAVNLTENIQWLVDITKRIDPEHETHANPNCPTGNGIMDGQDVYQQTQVLDSISESVHPSHHFYNEKNHKNYPISHSFSVDKVRSWGQALGKDAWIGELQAGTTFYHPNKYTPRAQDLSHVLWQSLGRGIKGLLFWEWQGWRSSMMEVSEFSLRRSADGGPTERSEAVRKFGKVLKDHATIFEQVRRPDSKIALLYSMDSSAYKAVQKRSKPFIEEIEHEHTFALYGCYKALNRANLPVDFINEARILNGDLARYEVLYLPHVELMTAGTAQAIRKFVHDGGKVWADGRCAFLDEHVYLRESIPGHGLDEVFGCREADFIACREQPGIHLDDGRMIQGYRFVQPLYPTSGTVLGKFKDDCPAIVSHRYGNGTAELVGTYLSLGLRNHDDQATMDYLADFAIRGGVCPEINIEPVNGFEVCWLTGDSHDVLVVTNHLEAASEARITAPRVYASIFCPMDDGAETSVEGCTIRRGFGQFESVVFLCRKD